MRLFKIFKNFLFYETQYHQRFQGFIKHNILKYFMNGFGNLKISNIYLCRPADSG